MTLIRRRRPGGVPYLTTPGGGVRQGESWVDALARECREELGATIEVGEVAYVVLPDGRSSSLQRFFACRLLAIDDAQRTGHEFSEPERGTYETAFVDPQSPELELLRPQELVPILRTSSAALRAELDHTF